MVDLILAIEACPLPVIAMIYGYCVGAGLGLTVSCDLRLAAENSRLGVTPAKLGAGYPASAILRFINIIGVSATKELFYTGRLIDAERAKEIGLVHQVVSNDQLATVTYDLARQIADNAPLSIRGIKIAISKLLSYQTVSPQTEEELLALEQLAADSEDIKEGQRAFLEKRKPMFKGR
jgi:enoyl-CoA hydratase/carnithine racemase